MIKPTIEILIPEDWQEYELLDSGNGVKLERYGEHKFVRPAPQAVWNPSLPQIEWQKMDGIFDVSEGEKIGHWRFAKNVPIEPWTIRYKNLKFMGFISGSRHIGVFPEQAPHWDWISQQVEKAHRQIKILNLFGYTGIASLTAAAAGASVTHVDASKRSIRIGQENQLLAGLRNASIRWIVDDVFKFVQREIRRQAKYDAIIMDPPKFGRGPKGEVWEFFKLMPYLLENCKLILSEHPLFIIITAYTIQASSLSLYYALESLTKEYGGQLTCGELALRDTSANRLLSMAIFVRWSIDQS